jgi:hypothetical protein
LLLLRLELLLLRGILLLLRILLVIRRRRHAVDLLLLHRRGGNKRKLRHRLRAISVFAFNRTLLADAGDRAISACEEECNDGADNYAGDDSDLPRVNTIFFRSGVFRFRLRFLSKGILACRTILSAIGVVHGVGSRLAS